TQFSRRESFLFKPNVVILGYVCQIPIFVLSKRHFVVSELDELVFVGLHPVNLLKKLGQYSTGTTAGERNTQQSRDRRSDVYDFGFLIRKSGFDTMAKKQEWYVCIISITASVAGAAVFVPHRQLSGDECKNNIATAFFVKTVLYQIAHASVKIFVVQLSASKNFINFRVGKYQVGNRVFNIPAVKFLCFYNFLIKKNLVV